MASQVSALRFYRESGNAVATSDASPHRLIAMLYDGILERLAHACNAIERGDKAAKVRSIDSTLSIIDYLRAVLDRDAGGEVAQQLDSLYDYMIRRLVVANIQSNTHPVREVMQLTMTIKEGWDAIAPGGINGRDAQAMAYAAQPLRAMG